MEVAQLRWHSIRFIFGPIHQMRIVLLPTVCSSLSSGASQPDFLASEALLNQPRRCATLAKFVSPGRASTTVDDDEPFCLGPVPGALFHDGPTTVSSDPGSYWAAPFGPSSIP